MPKSSAAAGASLRVGAIDPKTEVLPILLANPNMHPMEFVRQQLQVKQYQGEQITPETEQHLTYAALIAANGRNAMMDWAQRHNMPLSSAYPQQQKTADETPGTPTPGTPATAADVGAAQNEALDAHAAGDRAMQTSTYALGLVSNGWRDALDKVLMTENGRTAATGVVGAGLAAIIGGMLGGKRAILPAALLGGIALAVGQRFFANKFVGVFEWLHKMLTGGQYQKIDAALKNEGSAQALKLSAELAAAKETKPSPAMPESAGTPAANPMGPAPMTVGSGKPGAPTQEVTATPEASPAPTPWEAAQQVDWTAKKPGAAPAEPIPPPTTPPVDERSNWDKGTAHFQEPPPSAWDSSAGKAVQSTDWEATRPDSADGIPKLPPSPGSLARPTESPEVTSPEELLMPKRPMQFGSPGNLARPVETPPEQK